MGGRAGPVDPPSPLNLASGKPLLWCCTRRGAYVYRGQRFWPLPGTRRLPLKAVAVHPRGRCFLGTPRGVWELALGRCRRLRALPLTSLALDSRGELWIGTRDRGLFRHAGGRWGRYLAGRHLPAAGVNCLLEDVRGLLWIGTDDGLGLFDRPQWLTVVRGWDVVRLDPAPGGVWACYQEGAVRFQGFHVVEKIRPDDLPSPPVSLVHLTSGLLWAATREHGLWLRDPGGEWSRARLGRGLAGVVRLVPDHAQGIWLLCRDGGLWHAPAQGEPVPYGPEQGLPEEDILEMGWWPLPAAALPGPPEG